MRIFRVLLITLALIYICAALSLADISQGKKLFEDPKFAGSTNNKSCNSCHPDGRGLENASGKPQYSIMGSNLSSLEATVNVCIKKALKGKPLEHNSSEMKDIVEYIGSVKGKEFKERRVIKGC
ncbi:MAG: hypothetical protein JSV21_09685 [Nitrospirota bacterium]|nr:MAG: hypothetical protein JSV21_09685 [Nitrospirota bacterium]